MNYTDHFNQNTNTPKENENLLSFSFSLEEPKKVSHEELLSKVSLHLQDILNTRFSEWEKKKVLPKIGRLNFACPYCGDSHNDSHKKRGNIYTSSGFFKCYNCGKKRNLEGFLRDFHKELDTSELMTAREINENSRPAQRVIDPMMLHDHDELIKWSIDRSVIEEKFKLQPLDRSKIFVYLKKRLQKMQII
jgi:transcription elongation factor Elf1